MLNVLINKYQFWTKEKSDIFHNHVTRKNQDGLYIWEKDNNGFFIYRNTGAHYCSNRGMVYILTSSRNPNDWNSHVLFYEHIKNNSLCRIDVPIEYQKVILNNKIFHYIVFERPNKEYGRDYHQDIFDNKVNDQYFLQFIEDSSHIIKELVVCNTLHDTKFPNLGLTIFKRNFDSKSHFWIDFKYWDSSYESFIAQTYNTLEEIIFYLQYNSIGKYNKEHILNTAREIWNME